MDTKSQGYNNYREAQILRLKNKNKKILKKVLTNWFWCGIIAKSPEGD